MASWTKYFKAVPTQARLQNQLRIQNSDGGASGSGSVSSHKSFLPEIYSGQPNRIERYVTYWQMDLDSEISRALDTISDFSTQTFDTSQEPFKFNFKDSLTETETKLLTESLKQWCSLNNWQQRLWRMFRNTIMMGDQFFIRDPETFKLIWIDPAKVEKIIVNEASGKEIEQYVIRELDFNLSTLVGSNMLVHDQYAFPGGYPRSGNPASGSGTINYGQSTSPGSRNSRFDNLPGQVAVDAEHVLHLSISEGLDNQWPFGTSILESIYKVYKQKDLLEDAILIYRIVRAPERRVFYIDVGSLSGPRAMQYVEKVKNEIYQRRLPNSRCLSLETKIYLLDGRLLPLQEIIDEHNSGKQNWVYSCNPETGEVVPGKITWAGPTRSQTQVVRLTLDNGHQIICTPDHSFPILGKGFVEAQNLKIGESFIPLYIMEKGITPVKTKSTYTQIFNNYNKKWQFVHRLVAAYFKNHKNKSLYNEKVFDQTYLNSNKTTIHHSDFNRYNNNPENLIWMNAKDHIILHADASSTGINYDIKMFEMLHKVFVTSKNPSMSIHILAKQLTKNTKFMDYIRSKCPELVLENKLDKITTSYVKGIIRFARKQTFHEYRTGIIEKNNIELDTSYYQFNDKLFDIFKTTYHSSIEATMVDLVNSLKTNSTFVKEFNRIHSEGRVDKTFEIGYAYITMMLRHFGYKNFREFRKDNVNPNYFPVQNRNNITKYNYNTDMFLVLKKVYEKRKTNLHYTQKDVGFKSLYPELQKNQEFIDAFKKSNLGSKKNRFGPDMVKELLNFSGFKDYEDFKEKHQYLNHKLVSIEWLDTPIDTGTITVDGDEEFHNYHTFAIEGGIFTKNSNGGNAIDATYNPISINEDYYLGTNSEGKGTRIESLAGGDNLGSIDDLRYFSNKMMRGLGIPSSYLPTGPDDGTATYNDGKVGAAYIQEFRFSQYCKRLQNLMAPSLDREFKLFVKNRGIEIQSNLFELQFFPPQSFSEYRQIQIDSEQISVFSNLMGTEANKYLSKRFAMKRYLGLNDDEILENERLWKEENATKTKNRTGSAPVQNTIGLTNVGVTSPPEDTFGGEDFTNDQDLPNSEPEGTEGPGSPEAPVSAGSETGTEVNPPPELGPTQ